MPESGHSRLDELLSIWLHAPVKPPLEQLCQRDPELLPQLQREVAQRLRAQETRDVALSAGGAVLRPNEPPTQSVRPPQLDEFSDLSWLGAGGMGTVWSARQNSTQRLVAVKLMHPSFVGSPAAKVRFEREVELSARLEHPNIARIYERGVDRGIDFLAMELVVDGRTITEHVRAAHCTIEQIVDMMILVCRAVQHAHQRGVIHRDLKPSNILVTGDGQPKLLDFGLAKAVADSSVQLTMTGDIAGTPAYMSPEQARGDLRQVDTRSDVYSLGLILHELLTRRLPHDISGTYLEIMHRIAETEADSPRRFNPELDTDLTAVVLKSLSMQQSQRYSTAGQLADDLQRYRQNDAVLARPQTTLYLLRKGVRKHSKFATTASAIVIAIIFGVGAYVWQINQERERTSLALLRAQEQRRRAEENVAELSQERAAVLQLVNELLFRVNRLLAGSNADPVGRQSLIDLSRRALAQISAGRELEKDRARADAAAQLQLADLLTAAGKAPEAEAIYNSVLPLLQSAAAASPSAAQPHRDLAVAHTRLARLHLANGDLDRAIDSLNAAQQALSRLPSDAAAVDRWNVLVARGDVQTRQEQRLPAIASYREAAQLISKDSTDPELLRLRPIALTRLADASIGAGSSSASGASERLRESVQYFNDAIAAEDASEAAGAPVPLPERAIRRLKLAQVYLQLGEATQAADAATRAVDLFQQTVRQSATPDARQNLALALLVRADAVSTSSPTTAAELRHAAETVIEALRAEGDSAREPELQKLLDRAGRSAK